MSEQESENLTVVNLKNLVAQATELKKERDELEKAKKEKGSALDAVKKKILGHLEELELENFKVPGVGAVSINQKSSVVTPKTPEDKQLLFEWLAERGELYEVASVNSATLNSLYASVEADAIEAGDEDFSIPGVGEPMAYVTISLRKA